MPGVLHVCTANLIRSPIAEVLTRGHLPGYPVGSAGLRAREGLPIWPAAAEELARRGVPIPLYGAFRSRLLTPELAGRADLVLAATRRHRDAVVASSPALLGRVFTWRELAALIGGVTRDDVSGTTVPERIAHLLALVRAHRGRLVPPAGEDLDVADPVEGPEAALTTAIDQIEAALAAVLPLIIVPTATQGGRAAPEPAEAPAPAFTSPWPSPPPPPSDDAEPPLGTLLPTGFGTEAEPPYVRR
jgi:protein-tyrosine phosphatase